MNEDEVVDLARRTLDAGWNIRFIEWMPVGTDSLSEWREAMVAGDERVSGTAQDWRARVVTAPEIRAEIEAALGALEPVLGPGGGAGAGPARYYRLSGARGSVGFITAVSEHFCQHCNRLRLTADGQLRPCLLSDDEIDLRTPLRRGADVAQIQTLLTGAIAHKPLRHHLDEYGATQDCGSVRERGMSQIGG
jgi:cyclic pyranopterin phosphate synthase